MYTFLSVSRRVCSDPRSAAAVGNNNRRRANQQRRQPMVSDGIKYHSGKNNLSSGRCTYTIIRTFHVDIHRRNERDQRWRRRNNILFLTANADYLKFIYNLRVMASMPLFNRLQQAKINVCANIGRQNNQEIKIKKEMRVR